MKTKYMVVRCCEYCICGIRSHGEKILQGNFVGSGVCEWCDEEDDELYECMVEVE